MRILIIWGESLAKPGGGTVHCLGLADGLRAGGHRVTILTPAYRGAGPLHRGDHDCRAVPLPKRGLLSFAMFQLLTLIALPLWLLRHRPEAVYVRTCFAQGLMALLCRLAGVPLVGEVDSIVDQEILMRGQPRWAARAVRALDHLNNALSSGLVCVTRGLRDESVRRGARPATTVAIHNGARTDVFSPGDQAAAREQLDLPADGAILGFAGTFAPWQGLDLLLDATRELRDRPGPGPRIALMGGGQMETFVREAIARDGLEDLVRLLPTGPREQVRTFLAACDAAVVPIHDPRKLRYGLSVLKFWDAVSAGLPVLVPAGCEMDEILASLDLPGSFDPTSATSLAEAMQAVADDIDRLRARRWEVHRHVDAHYSWPRVAGRVVALMDRLRRPGRSDR